MSNGTLGKEKSNNNHKVVNHWIGSSASEKDLHIVAEHKLNASANYQKMGNPILESMFYTGHRSFTFLFVSLSFVLAYGIWFWMPHLERHK